MKPGEGTEDTRQVVTRKQMGERNWGLVTRLASERLVTTGITKGSEQEEIAEVIHEALIRSWQRFREWIDSNREFRIWQNHLRQTVEIWEKGIKDEGMLLQGRQLLQAEDYLESRKGQIEDTESTPQSNANRQGNGITKA